MKNILAITFLTAFLAGHSQEFNYPIKGDVKEITLYITNFNARIEIEGNTGSEIKITTDNYRGMPEKAKGLKPLSTTAPENTGIGLSILEEVNKITLMAANREVSDATYKILLPKELKLKIDNTGWNAEDIIIKKMASEIEVKTQVSNVDFKDVTGPIVAYTLSADLEILFIELSQSSPYSLVSTSGDIDITIPSNTKGTFKMSTMSGGVYTDLDFEVEESSSSDTMMIGENAIATLNGGGVDVSLKTVSGNIYVRKTN